MKTLILLLTLLPSTVFAQGICDLYDPVAPDGAYPVKRSSYSCGMGWEQPSGWQTVYNADWTSLDTSQAMFVDGASANVIGGYWWTGENLASAATDARVVSGTGLRIQSNTTATRLGESVRTAPILTMPIAAVDGRATVGMRTRVWVRVGGNWARTSDSCYVGLETYPHVATEKTRYGLVKTWTSTGLQWAVEMVEANTIRTTYSSAVDTTHDVAVVEYVDPTTGILYTGQSSPGAWPTEASLRLRGVYRKPPSASNVAGYVPFWAGRDAAILLSAYAYNPTGNTCEFQAVMIQLRP